MGKRVGDGCAPDHRKWVWSEDKVLLENYARIGAVGCEQLLPDRRRNQIIGRAHKLRLRAPNTKRRFPLPSEAST